MLDSAAFFQEQADQSPHVHFLYDVAQQRVVFINAAYERVLQGTCAHVNQELPALLARLHPDEQPLWQRYWPLWQQGRLRDEVEVRLRTSQGDEDQWLCLTPHWHQDADGHTYIGGTLRDITAGKQHRANSDKFNSKKNTVLEILSHDLAGAFVLQQQLTQYVQEEIGTPANSRVPEMLQLMQRTSQQSLHLIHDLVDQEFLESAEVPLRLEWVDLREKVQQCIEPFRRAPGSEARQLALKLPEEPAYAAVDVTKLLQVVTNLVSNALKFTSDQGRITVKVESGSGSVRITVADEGIGIAAHLQPVLFEKFTPARRPGLRGEPTTGLGLSLCKTIVELHGGSLTVHSAEGSGSSFIVELPVAQVPT